jgi:cytochrome d ubiquinol oxidase subunit I
VGSGAFAVSFAAFTVLFAVLVGVNAWLLARFARRGPEGVALGAAPPVGPSAPAVSATF